MWASFTIITPFELKMITRSKMMITQSSNQIIYFDVEFKMWHGPRDTILVSRLHVPFLSARPNPDLNSWTVSEEQTDRRSPTPIMADYSLQQNQLQWTMPPHEYTSSAKTNQNISCRPHHTHWIKADTINYINKGEQYEMLYESNNDQICRN
jgi:hypothetical protein